MNKYKDKKGHWTNKENDGGECHHDFGSVEDFDKENWEDLENPFSTSRLTKHEDDTPERLFGNKQYKIMEMTPEEYFKISAAMFETSPDKLKEQRKMHGGDSGLSVTDIREKMRQGEKFGMAYIEYNDSARGENLKGGQEGLHRMMAAGEEYGWDKKFPVVFVQPKNSKTTPEQLLSDVDSLVKKNRINKNKRENYYKRKMENEKNRELESISLELGIPVDKLTEEDIKKYYDMLEDLFEDLF